MISTVFDIVIVELLQTPMDDPQKPWSGAWKAVGLVADGTWMLLGIAMLCWVRAGMEVVDGSFAGQGHGLHVWRCRSTSRVRSDTLITLDHTDVQVRTFRV